MEFGIDVSHHNEVKDWHKVRGNNITFASIKVTDGEKFVDPQARHHVPGARAAGVRTGGYHFARKGNVQKQVDLFFEHLHARALLSSTSMAPMLDMEAADLRSTANTFIPQFIAKLRAKAGIKRIFVYANLDWFENVLRPNEWADANVMLWVARFNGNPGKPGFEHSKLVLHQHSDKGNVPGIPGHVDRDATVGNHKLADLLVGAVAPAPA
jgi:GH25 family lysozyme M1 (1,4-beta-N-acetylmuramidase)